MLLTCHVLFILQNKLSILIFNTVIELPHHFWSLHLLAHGTTVVILKPFLNTVRVEQMLSLASQRSHIVLTLDKRLEANDALIHHAGTSYTISLVKKLFIEGNTRHRFDQIMLQKFLLSFLVGLFEDLPDVEGKHQNDSDVRR